MVMGIFLSLLLVGALWSIAGTGEAIILRERLQEGADAAALGAAEIDARAMNTIAVLNLVVTAIMSVRASILAMLIVGNVQPFAAYSPGAYTPAAQLYPTLGPIGTYAQTLYGKWDANISSALTGLNAAQYGVSSATPAVAAAGANDMALLYDPTVQASETVVAGTPATAGGTLPINPTVDTIYGLCTNAAQTADPSGGTNPPPPTMVNKLVAQSGFSPASDALAGILYTIGQYGVYGDSPLCEPTVSPNVGLVKFSNATVNGGADSQIFTSVGMKGTGASLATGVVQLAARGSVDMSTPDMTSAAFSQAEFFFDCPGSWDFCLDFSTTWFNWRPHFRLFSPASATSATLPATALLASERIAEAAFQAKLTAQTASGPQTGLADQLSSTDLPALAAVSMTLH
jgi:hypothetical protein